MKLTIGITVCDKDAALLPRLLEEIAEGGDGETEVIVYNNSSRPLESGGFIPLGNFTGDEQPENRRQLHARKAIAEAASGDYVWMVDGDDDILPFDTKAAESGADMIVFTTTNTAGVSWSPFNGEEAERLEVSAECLEKIGFVLWCKWIKADILKKAYGMIDLSKCEYTSCAEDLLASALCLKWAETIAYYPMCIYNKRMDRGYSDSADTDAECIKNIMAGLGTITELFHSLFTEEELEKLSLADIFGLELRFILNRALTIKDDGEFRRACLALLDKIDFRIVFENMVRVISERGESIARLKILREADEEINGAAAEA